MEKFGEENFAGVPERFREEGVIAHYREQVRVGDTVEAIRNIRNGEVPLGTQAEITDIIIEPNSGKRGFMKRIKIKGFPGEYNPQRFKRVDLEGENDFSMLNLLGGCYDIEQEDIDQFRENRVTPRMIALFESITEEDKKKMIVIDRLPPDQLQKLISVSKQKNKEYAGGLHNLRSLLLNLNNVTEDEKYADI